MCLQSAKPLGSAWVMPPTTGASPGVFNTLHTPRLLFCWPQSPEFTGMFGVPASLGSWLWPLLTLCCPWPFPDPCLCSPMPQDTAEFPCARATRPLGTLSTSLRTSSPGSCMAPSLGWAHFPADTDTAGLGLTALLSPSPVPQQLLRSGRVSCASRIPSWAVGAARPKLGPLRPSHIRDGAALGLLFTSPAQKAMMGKGNDGKRQGTNGEREIAPVRQ